jgi:hypothetical protein
MSVRPPSAPSGAAPRLWPYALLFAACAASVFVLKLAPFLLVGCFIAFVALPKERPRWLAWCTAGAGLLATAGFLRFLVIEAMPGIVQGGTRATENAAVSKLREILFAENSLRKKAEIDPDGDGIGSAGLLTELAGFAGLRGGKTLVPPLLEHVPSPIETPIGDAVELGGYLFVVCLPKPGGGFTAEARDAVDEEAAERRFLAYAWPSADKRGLKYAFFMDEHERILFAKSSNRPGKARRLGPDAPPSCDDAVAAASASAWQVWRHKQPRRALPGDRAQ